MRPLLALSAALLLGACESDLNHLLTYDDVRHDRAAAAAPAPPPPAPVAVTAPRAIAPPSQIVTPRAAPSPQAAPPPQPVALTPVESPNMAFCRGVAEGDARVGDFDSTTRRARYDRGLAQCLALHGN